MAFKLEITQDDINAASNMIERHRNIFDNIYEEAERNESAFMKYLNDFRVRQSRIIDYTPKKIIHNENAVIVFWRDNTKTVVKKMEGDTDDVYSAYAQALAKKIFGGTCTVHKMVDRAVKKEK